jgi:hypothetical protein
VLTKKHTVQASHIGSSKCTHQHPTRSIGPLVTTTGAMADRCIKLTIASAAYHTQSCQVSEHLLHVSSVAG